MESCKEWADVASAIVGAPSGLKLLRNAPLGWGRSTHVVHHNFLRRRCPVLWFAAYTPLATQYELKYCKRVLTRSTVSAVERSCLSQQRSYTEAARTAVVRDATAMASDQRFWILRCVAYFVTKVFFWMFGHDLYVDESGIDAVRELQKTHTLVYVPSHKSHLDSVIMGYVAFSCGLEPPHIAAGNNLMLPWISYFMRGSGAFFIRRSNKTAADQEIYKKTLAGFVEGLLGHGKHMEFFIEAGRSRDGCLLKPKMGLLSYIVDAFIDVELPKSGNVALVPVNIGYDHPYEERGMIEELLGKPKQKETFWALIKSFFKLFLQSWTSTPRRLGIGGRCGCATVTFGTPLHLQKLLRLHARGMRFIKRDHRNSPVMTTRATKKNDLLQAVFPFGSEERSHAVSSLGSAIHAQLRRLQVIPASSILFCSIFLHHFVKGGYVTMGDTVMCVDTLQRLLDHTDATFMGFDPQCRRITLTRILGFASRFHSWLHITPQDTFEVRQCMEASVAYYIRSNHLLSKLSPSCLVCAAVLACIHGFDNDHARDRCAPRQSDFVSSPYADRPSIIAAALWLREVLSPEVDPLIGEESFRTAGEVERCLDGLLEEGVLMPCILPRYNHKRASSMSSSQASGTQNSQRRSFDRVVDHLIFGMMEDMEVRGRASMQFESDLKKYKEVNGQTIYNSRHHHKLSATLQELNSNTAPEHSEAGTQSTDYVTFSGDVLLGGDVYSLLYSPLIATYIQLFQAICVLFREKSTHSEKDLTQQLMHRLRDGWTTTDRHLCQRPVPCITIVQRFLTVMKTQKIIREDSNFTPYPLLSVNAMVQGPRPPRPSLGEAHRKGPERDNANASLVSVASLAEPSEELQLHVRREFRDGGINEVPSKLSLFLTSCTDALF